MLKPHINIFVVIRILIGLVLVFSGAEKLLSHYQNFLYVVQSYELLPESFEKPFVFIFPWIELLTGLFLVLGLWMTVSLKSVTVLFAVFIFVLSQATIRHLPVMECGCFGGAVTIPIHVTLILDSMTFLLIIWLNLNAQRTSRFGLDQYFNS